MDQSSLGSPRSLNSEILIDVEIESTDEQITQQDIQDEEYYLSNRPQQRWKSTAVFFVVSYALRTKRERFLV